MRVLPSRLAWAGLAGSVMHVALLALILASRAEADYSGDCYQYKDLDRTIRGCTLVINNVTLTPKDRANAADWRCWAYYLKDDYDRALADCTKAIELNPRLVEAFRDRCLIHAYKDQYDLAIADCDRALELRPEDAEALDNRCWTYYRKGDYDRALADCNKAIELKPDNHAAFADRCFVYNAKEQYDLAIRDCSKSIELKPTNGYAYWDRGSALNKKGNYAAALADLKKAEELLSRSGAENLSNLRDLIRQAEAGAAGAAQPGTSATSGAAESTPTAQQEPPLTRDERRAVQQRLKVLGFYGSGIDGSFGPGTRKAIKDFQRENGLVATGYVDRPMMDLLASKAAAREQELAAQQKAAASPATLSYESWTIHPLCSQALAGNKTDWDKDERFAGAVREAKRRQLNVGECRVAVGLPREIAQPATAAQQPASSAYESWAIHPLCSLALTLSKSEWDKREKYAGAVREAKRRNLSVGECRVAIGLPREPQQPTASTEAPQPTTPAATAPNDFSAVIATLQPIDDLFVAVRPAKVRAAPNVAATVVETLAIDDRVQVLGRLPGQDWYLVARDGNPHGYVVMNQLVSEVDYAKAQAPTPTSAGTSTPADQPITLPPELAALDYGRYYALVIGNADYRLLPKLRTAVDDAKAVAAVLEQDYGFVVSLIADGTEKAIISEISRLRHALTPGDNLLIYYAGHGWYDEGAERGYWLPVDATEDDRSHWISTADVTDALKAMRAKHVIVVADSCYSGSLTRGLTIGSSYTYFADIVGKRARTALTSGGLEPVTDAGGGGHSVFAKAFLAALQANNSVIGGEGIYHRVYQDVRLNAEQEPGYGNIRLAGHDGGDFLFVRRQ